MGTTLSAVAPQRNAAHLRGRIACAAACSTAVWHGVADHGPRSRSETADQGAMTAERPEDEVRATKDARGVHQALAGDAAPHLPGRWVLGCWSRCATPLPSQSFLRRKVRPQKPLEYRLYHAIHWPSFQSPLPYLSSVKYASKNKRVPDNAPRAKKWDGQHQPPRSRNLDRVGPALFARRSHEKRPIAR
jgi:hypothetical protein